MRGMGTSPGQIHQLQPAALNGRCLENLNMSAKEFVICFRIFAVGYLSWIGGAHCVQSKKKCLASYFAVIPPALLRTAVGGAVMGRMPLPARTVAMPTMLAL
jgi:hypothetical protein